MGTEAGVEEGIIFQNDDGGFYSVERGASLVEDRPTCGERALTSRFARVDSFIGNIPGAAVNDKGRFHVE